MSYGNSFTIYTFQNGIDLITGANGLGKSAIVDALMFVLYGKSYRKTKLGTLVNDINQKELLVETEFSIDKNKYKIIRGIKPNIFEIYINDILLPQEASVKDYQLYLEDNILRINEQTFRQLIVLGANISSTKPFLELPQSEKEEVFHSVINTSIFNQMLEVIKTRIQNKKTIRTESEYKIDILQTSYTSELENIKKLKANNDEFNSKHKTRRINLELEITEAKQELQKIDTVISKTKKVKDLLIRKQEQLDTIQTDYKETIKLLEHLKHEKNSITRIKNTHAVCIGCENLIKISNIDINTEDQIDFKLELAQKDKEFQEEDITKLDTDIKELQQKILKIKSFLTNKKNLEHRIQQIEEEFKEIDSYVLHTIQEDNLNKLKKDITETKEILDKVTNELNNLDKIKKVLLDKELRGAIIQKQLPVLNKLINEYLEKFSSSEFNMIIDSDFKEKILTSRNIQKEFNQLSNGQKFRLTFSLIFAFLKFIETKNAVQTNILVADEVLDTSLDAEGRDDLLHILYNEFSDRNIVIISHNKDIVQKEELFNRTINIYKDQQFSKIKGI
jgi:DNA repair exonuclease SbcCD ATPase subunit